MVSESVKSELKKRLAEDPKLDLVSAFLYYLEHAHQADPVLYPGNKTIYFSPEVAAESMGKEGKLWRETEILVSYDQGSVNEETQKIYICPFSGKVFGDNTHPNPQDAVYDWVSKCPENTELIGGLRSKRFHVSEDPEVIKNYIQETQKSVKKTVFSSAINGKLFNSKEAIIRDFKQNYLKPMTLVEVQGQNRFQMGEELLHFFQKYLNEECIGKFINELSEDSSFAETINAWVGEDE